MQLITRLIISALFTLFPCFLSAAQNTVAKETTDKVSLASLPWTVNFYFENDLFTASDKNYTNGARVSWVSPDIDDFINDPRIPPWASKLNQQLTLLDPTPNVADDVLRRLVLTAGQQIYTPTDISRTTLDPNDRPYAGWLYGGVMYHARTNNTLHSTGANLGIVGPWALGEETQNTVHRTRGLDEWEGWDNQLENELAFQIIFERKDKWLQSYIYRGLGYDFISHYGTSVGNLATYLNGGAEFRLGWRLPSDMGTGSLRPGGDNSSPSLRHLKDNKLHYQAQGKQLGAHAFISTDIKRVFYDIFLDGNSIANSHSIDKEMWVSEAAIGLAMFYKSTKFSFARVHRTPEFKQQDKGHSYGSIALTMSF
ncbi:MAG: lipid A deacylase LpxR family protein [Pontibacterium sp.]